MTNKDSEGDAKQQFVTIDEIQNRLPATPAGLRPSARLLREVKVMPRLADGVLISSSLR
jgi:hypothetical protein